MDQDDWCYARRDEHGKPGGCRVVAWSQGVLRRLEGLLHLDVRSGVLQTRDRQALLPDGPHVSTPLLGHQAALLR
jgi:hypothetical protein